MAYLYFRWLESTKGILYGPDALIINNLRSIGEAGSLEVLKKRKHADMPMNQYVNDYLVKNGDQVEEERFCLGCLSVLQAQRFAALRRLPGRQEPRCRGRPDEALGD